ncbi:MAG: hypothetical protein WC910_08785 [Bacteroidales bacterium]|jgi:hypothetical protein
MRGVICWIIAIVITLVAVFFQRSTGPSHPSKELMEVSGGSFKTVFPRSLVRPENNNTATLLTVKIRCTPKDQEKLIGAVLYYKRYPGTDNFTPVVPSFSTEDNELLVNAEVPVQPAAGKITYYIQLIGQEGIVVNSEHNILRFRDHVPAVILILHIMIIFFAFLFSNFTGLYTFAGNVRINPYALATMLLLFAGGFILGPLVQKYAFGVWWSGWPLGGDMTDTKTLVALVAWITAYVLNRIPFSAAGFCRLRRYLYLVAALITMAVYSIPHSTAGSEYDYQTGTVMTGNRE